MKRSDTAQAVLDALAQGHREGATWVRRYLGHGDSLTSMLDRIWRQRFPNRRNRPTHRNIEAALRQLIRDGVIEHKAIGGIAADDAYRLADPPTGPHEHTYGEWTSAHSPGSMHYQRRYCACGAFEARPVPSRDPLMGPCARPECGKMYDDHPGGFCPHGVGADGLVDAATAPEFVPADETP